MRHHNNNFYPTSNNPDLTVENTETNENNRTIIPNQRIIIQIKNTQQMPNNQPTVCIYNKQQQLTPKQYHCTQTPKKTTHTKTLSRYSRLACTKHWEIPTSGLRATPSISMKQPRQIAINTASRYTYFSTLISLIPPSYRALLLRPSNHPLSGITHSPNYWVLHRNNPEPTHNTSEPKSNPTDSLCLRPLTCPLILNCCEPTGNNNEPNNNTL